jgi:hypothetical protein
MDLLAKPRGFQQFVSLDPTIVPYCTHMDLFTNGEPWAHSWLFIFWRITVTLGYPYGFERGYAQKLLYFTWEMMLKVSQSARFVVPDSWTKYDTTIDSLDPFQPNGSPNLPICSETSFMSFGWPYSKCWFHCWFQAGSHHKQLGFNDNALFF